MHGVGCDEYDWHTTLFVRWLMFTVSICVLYITSLHCNARESILLQPVNSSYGHEALDLIDTLCADFVLWRIA